MKLKLTKGRAASRSEITALERKIGMAIAPEFVEFAVENDGAEPETNIFKISEANESGVNGFIPVKEIYKESSRIENLPQFSFPVAWAEGGNYVLICQGENGAVYFWDHEQPDNITRLAANFGLFLNLLEPFDVSTVKLKPGQVKEAWIDPDFLKSLKG
ncbi:SMI1/KNR4 family protein [Undibacterium sp. CY21W]|uniref:SMI1/KNR4 family protein n=1 Tax=Undibacterium sp. CY21W TaxID=2762293 RepID=UPI00164B358D|nr:SMI1/KNR4 family protein [Undibacterium sp. CY21W]MBC3930031.1 SMI1/KNR4 family protein [Undibacterium sp. CY21W]